MRPRTGCSTGCVRRSGTPTGRDDLRCYVVEHLGDQDAVLVVDLCRPRDCADQRGVGAESLAVVGFLPMTVSIGSA
jgi:hypothetical protein